MIAAAERSLTGAAVRASRCRRLDQRDRSSADRRCRRDRGSDSSRVGPLPAETTHRASPTCHARVQRARTYVAHRWGSQRARNVPEDGVLMPARDDRPPNQSPAARSGAVRDAVPDGRRGGPADAGLAHDGVPAGAFGRTAGGARSGGRSGCRSGPCTTICGTPSTTSADARDRPRLVRHRSGSVARPDRRIPRPGRDTR